MNASLPNVLTDGTFTYVYGLGLAYAVGSSGNPQVYHDDGLGSARALTNGSGTLLATYLTTAFGVPLPTTINSSQPFQFTGQQRDASTNLYYLRARMYDPSIGRFLSRDSVFGVLTNPLSQNRFGYALDNPLLLADPSGLSLSRVTNNDGSTDNQCFSTAGGLFKGNLINASCLDTRTGSHVVIAYVDFPPPPHWTETVVFLDRGQRGGGGGKRSPKSWTITKEGTDQVVVHSTFGVISRHISSGLWWARDLAEHGRSVWKVFTEESRGLRHPPDADEFGNFITDKHKGLVGEFIPSSELRGR